MIHHLAAVLSPEDVAWCRRRLQAAAWVDGRITAGAQSARAKSNLQLDERSSEAAELGELILERLGSHPGFISAALPARVFPPLFNRYDEGMGFGAHIDNAIRTDSARGRRVRTDLSCTLFLSEPDDYDGGELQIEDQPGAPSLKLPAGDMALYPATSVHRVTPVTRGTRWASFFWVQSMIRDNGQRALLHGLDRSIATVRADLGDDHPAAVRLTGTYHNLVRMWAEF